MFSSVLSLSCIAVVRKCLIVSPQDQVEAFSYCGFALVLSYVSVFIDDTMCHAVNLLNG